MRLYDDYRHFAMSDQPLPLPEYNEPLALFYALGYIDFIENPRTKNPFIRDGKKSVGAELWERGFADSSGVDKQ